MTVNLQGARKNPKLSPVVTRSDPQTLLIVYRGHTWKCSVSSVLKLHEHKHTLRSIVALREQKHRSMVRWSARMSALGKCQNEPCPLLVAFPLENKLRLLVGNRAWGCSMSAALGPPQQTETRAQPNDKGDNDVIKKRKPGGWPAWKFNADQILNGIRVHVGRGGENRIHAVADFIQILDVFLSQLIEWTEQKDSMELRNWAGMMLMDRLQFLFAQERGWRGENEGFEKRRNEFGDRRRARAPLEYLAWLAGDYLRMVTSERLDATLVLSPPPGESEGPTIAELLNYSKERVSWLTRLRDMPEFNHRSAKEWAEMVFERMQQDEQRILSAPEMQNRKPRPDIADRRSDTRFIVRAGKLSVKSNKRSRGQAKVRLYDFHSTIVRAVATLAYKPKGNIRGVTSPSG